VAEDRYCRSFRWPAYGTVLSISSRSLHLRLACVDMFGVSSFICLALISTAVSGTPGLSFITHEKAKSVPAGFSLRGPAAPDTTLDLRIALRQNDVTGLEKVFLDISNPDSPQYGHHLSRQQVDAYVEPSADTLSKVNSWLSSHNLTATNATHAGDWIRISAPVHQANKMFNASFDLFHYPGNGEQLIRTLAYSIPAELKNHIDLVHPTVR
jgi:tripeptidyl-peptidase-1